MKNKLLSILHICIALSCAIMIYLHSSGRYILSSKAFSRLIVLFVVYAIYFLHYYFKEKAPNSPARYAESYKHILRDAFSRDKTGYRKLMQGISLYNDNQYDKAIKHLIKLEKRCISQRDTSAVLFFIAKSYKDKGATGMAIEYYERLLKTDPSNSTAWSNLGLIHHEAGRAAEAKYALNQALLYNPDNAYAHCNLANVLYRNGDFEAAKNMGLKSFQLNNQLSAAASIIALSYASLGDAENARKYCKIYGTYQNNNDLIAMVERQLKSK